MRTKIFALVIASMFIATTSVVAGEKEGKNIKETTSVSTYLKKTIGYPTFAQEASIEGVVNVVVELNDSKELKVANIWGSDQRLVEFVERKLKHLDESPVVFPNEESVKRYVLRFKIS